MAKKSSEGQFGALITSSLDPLDSVVKHSVLTTRQSSGTCDNKKTPTKKKFFIGKERYNFMVLPIYITFIGFIEFIPLNSLIFQSQGHEFIW
jgi:hypothetical protein